MTRAACLLVAWVASSACARDQPADPFGVMSPWTVYAWASRCSTDVRWEDDCLRQRAPFGESAIKEELVSWSASCGSEKVRRLRCGTGSSGWSLWPHPDTGEIDTVCVNGMSREDAIVQGTDLLGQRFGSALASRLANVARSGTDAWDSLGQFYSSNAEDSPGTMVCWTWWPPNSAKRNRKQ